MLIIRFCAQKCYDLLKMQNDGENTSKCHIVCQKTTKIKKVKKSLKKVLTRGK